MSGWILTLGSVDERLLHALVLRRRRYLDIVMRGITHLGDWQNIVAITLAFALGLVPELQGPGVVAAWALASSHLVVQILKRTIVRPRPRLPMGLAFLIKPQDRFSFPSGHAAAGLSVGLPFFLALAGPWAWAALALGLMVGVSRCYLGVHYPGDVLVGWTLAALAVLLTAPFLGIVL
jgi:undecaprenyl-diphosphatase